MLFFEQGSSEEFKREEPKAANHDNSPPAKPKPPPLTPSAPPDVPPRPGEVPKHAHLPMPADSTMLPSFDPQTGKYSQTVLVSNSVGRPPVCGDHNIDLFPFYEILPLK